MYKDDVMGWYFDDNELKTKQDYINQLKEIEAYRRLDGQDFDFGTGVIKNEMLQGSEDAYYEMDIQLLEEIIKYWDYETYKNKKKKNKLNRYSNKMIDKKKLKMLKKINGSLVSDYKGYLTRNYRGKRSKFLKQVGNKKVRKYNSKLSSGGADRKIFDYWGTMY